MKELLKLGRSQTLIWKEFPYGDHNNTVAEPGYFSHIEDLLQRHVLK
jgi:hypothetical protein